MKRMWPLLLLALPSAAFAHGGAHAVEKGPPGWTWDASVTLPLGIAFAIYLTGFVRLRARAGGGRRNLWHGFVRFMAGWLILALSLVSPLHEAGERSFTLHMIEHELIMLVAALLLSLSQPIATMLWAFPRSTRRTLAAVGHAPVVAKPWRFLTDPVTATILQAIALWAWHAPPLFDRALGHEGWHVAQHLSFLVTALLFWWAMVRTRSGTAAMCLFLTSIVGGALGALMALSASPWYAGYAAMGMMPFGLTPEEDQQLAGLIMWIPGGLVHAGAALAFLAQYLRMEGRHVLESR